MVVKTKGYRVPRVEYAITFEGTDYDGAEMHVLGASLGILFEFQRAEGSESSFRRFGDDHLVSWNLEDDDGKPVPATGDGFLSQPPDFCLTVIKKWSEALAGVPGPLGSPSSNGALSAVG